MQENLVLFLGWEDLVEKVMATHSSILVWRIPWGHKESDMTEQLSLSPFTKSINISKNLISETSRNSRILKDENYIYFVELF